MATRSALRFARSSSSISKRFLSRGSFHRSGLIGNSTDCKQCDIDFRTFTMRSLLDESRIMPSVFNQVAPPNGSVLGFSLNRSRTILFSRHYNAAADLPPFQEIGMPSLSPTMTQGNIAKWRKAVGDSVTAGDVLCEIETDKATLEMESMEDGFVAKILHGEGSKDIPVGTPIAIMVDSADDISKFANYSVESSHPAAAAPAAPAEAAAPPTPSPPSPPPSLKFESQKSSRPSPVADSNSRIFASPAARKFAEENNVDMNLIEGTGPDGRVVKADVEDYLDQRVKPKAAAVDVSYTDIPTTQMRKVIASRLLFSKQTIPHYYLSMDVNVDKLIELRKELNAIQEKNGGPKISVNDFILKASALACKKVPECNSSWENDHIRQYSHVDVNFAVQTENGLMVPFVKNTDMRGLSSIAAEVRRLATAAREHKLKPEEYQGGTFSVSNLGMFGIDSFCAVINPPQSAILAVGASKDRVVLGNSAGELRSASVMSVTLSCDHRVIDGAVGAKWLNVFKEYIEDPSSMLL